jgi:hypothetical protein
VEEIATPLEVDREDITDRALARAVTVAPRAWDHAGAADLVAAVEVPEVVEEDAGKAAEKEIKRSRP